MCVILSILTQTTVVLLAKVIHSSEMVGDILEELINIAIIYLLHDPCSQHAKCKQGNKESEYSQET